jgi:ABC-type branched-subunit amino acid transport system substrate-binding protein
VYIGDLNSGAKALGFDVDLGNAEAQAKAAATAINASGGMGGRKVEVVVFQTDTASVLANTEVVQQSACDRFTQDDKVDAVVSYLPNMQLLESCLTNRKVFVVRAYYGGRSDKAIASFGARLRQPGAMSIENGVVALIDGLGKRDYWKGRKLGWFLPDNTDHANIENNAKVKAALNRYGITSIETFRYSPTDVQAGARAGQSAVLRFASSGVDRVILSGLGSTTYFMQAASQQNYVPGYAINSDVEPVATPLGVTDERQLNAIAGVGWQPATDIGLTQVATRSVGQKACVAAMDKAGQSTSSDAAAVLAMLVCDGFFFLDYAADRTGGSVLPTDADAAVRRDFSHYASPATQRVDLRNLDGALDIQLFRYDDQKNVFQYTTAPSRGR